MRGSLCRIGFFRFSPGNRCLHRICVFPWCGGLRFRGGFARIAEAARVPVLPAVLDYSTHTVRFRELIEDVTNVDAIIERVRLEAAGGVVRG